MRARGSICSAGLSQCQGVRPHAARSTCHHAVVYGVRAWPHNSIFKSEAKDADMDKVSKDIEQQGGKIGQRYGADFLRGFAANAPEGVFQQLQADTKNGQHASMYVACLT